MDDFFLGGSRSTKGVGIFAAQADKKFTVNINSPDDFGSPTQKTSTDSSVQTLLNAAKDFTPTAERAGKFITLSHLKNAADIAVDAIEKISTLRQKQYDLATDASDSAQGAHTAKLQTEYTNIDTEISRIVSTASYNGTPLLTQSNTFSADVSSISLTDTVTLPKLSESFTAGYAAGTAVTLSTQTGATSAVDALFSSINSIEEIKTGAVAAQSKANSLLENAVADAKNDTSANTDEKTATELSHDIALQLSSPSLDDLAKKQIIDATIGALDSKRADSLLFPDDQSSNDKKESGGGLNSYLSQF